MDKREILSMIRFGQQVAENEIDDLGTYFVETDHWRRLFAGEIDIVYGSKGSGKSALYFLLLAREDALLDRGILVAAGENPRGAPAFRDLVADPPTSEAEFMGLWKLYFACLLSDLFAEYGVSGPHATELRHALEQEGLVQRGRNLQTVLQGAFAYVKKAFRPSSIEAGVDVDPLTQLPRSFRGRITFREPVAEIAASGYRSVDQLLTTANEALKAEGFAVWLLLDRLDVAFAESGDLEQNALRALFRVYLDLRVLDNVQLKVFLRSDIWDQITSAGFREASHIGRKMTIGWDRPSLLSLVVSRAARNAILQELLRTSREEAIQSSGSQERFFYRLFPDQVDVGSRKPRTFDWMLTRTKDGTGRNAPRELIHFLNSLREVQVRRLEIGESPPEGESLFSRGAFKDALPEVSRTRLEQTIYAEYPNLRTRLEALRRSKTRHTGATLAQVWKVDVDRAKPMAEELVEVGFFEQRGTQERPEYWVPFLYRDALDMVQGTAEESDTES